MKLCEVKRPFPTAKPMRSGAIVDIENFTHGERFVRNGNLRELSKKEEIEYLKTATSEDLERIKIINDNSVHRKASMNEKAADEMVEVPESEKPVEQKIEELQKDELTEEEVKDSAQKTNENPVLEESSTGIEPVVQTKTAKPVEKKTAAKKTPAKKK